MACYSLFQFSRCQLLSSRQLCKSDHLISLRRSHFLHIGNSALLFNLCGSKFRSSLAGALSWPSVCCVSPRFSTFSLLSRPISSPDFSQLPGARKPASAPRRAPAGKLPQSFDAKAAKEALHHCVSLVKKRDFNNYLAALLMPPPARPNVFALLAFNVELAVVRDQIRRNEGTAGIYRLQFWRDAVNSIYGNDDGPIPRQPVALALRYFAQSASVENLLELISARQSTLGDRAFPSLQSVEEYGRRCNGSLIKLVMDVLANTRQRQLELIGKKHTVGVNEAAKKAAEEMGAVIGIVTLLRSTVPMLSRGIVLLPSDLLQIHGLTPDGVYSNKKPDAIRGLALDMAKKAQRLVSECRSRRDSVPCVLRPALMADGATVDDVLKTLRTSDYNLFNPRLQRGFSLVAWRLWWRRTVGRY